MEDKTKHLLDTDKEWQSAKRLRDTFGRRETRRLLLFVEIGQIA